MIKHVSFDVWNTLVVANPHFAAARAELLSEVSGVPAAQCKAVYTRVKQQLDRTASEYGIGAPVICSLDKLMLELTGKQAHHDVLDKLQYNIERLFALYPPKVTDAAIRTISTLLDKGILISIGSNTNFVSGRVMHQYLRRVLQFHAGPRPFFGGVYSDEVLTSKPSEAFFAAVIDLAQHTAQQNHQRRTNEQILHVGDNYVCDVEGPMDAGMHAALVPTPDQLFDVVFDSILEISRA